MRLFGGIVFTRMMDNVIREMEVVMMISDFLFFSSFLIIFLSFPFLRKNFRKPPKKKVFLYIMSCMFLISFHLLHFFALLDCKENHQKDLTNLLFNFLFFMLNRFYLLYAAGFITRSWVEEVVSY